MQKIVWSVLLLATMLLVCSPLVGCPPGGEGEGEGEGEAVSLCDLYDSIEQQSGAFRVRFEISTDADIDNDGLPEDVLLTLLRLNLCDEGSATSRKDTLGDLGDLFAANLAELEEQDNPALADFVELLALVFAVSGTTRDAFIAELGAKGVVVTGDYGSLAPEQDVFTGDRDLDGDGVSNAAEFGFVDADLGNFFAVVGDPNLSGREAEIRRPLPEGYTPFVKSNDTQAIYISSSTGNDANDGLTPATPVATLAEGRSLLRDGFPDWMLLKRGDTWAETLGRPWVLSGRSTAEPMVIYSYGDSDERPIVFSGADPESGRDEGFWISSQTATVSHLVLAGIHFSPIDRTTGVVIFGPANDILIEDCYIEGHLTNLIIQKESGAIDDIRVRRCIIVDSYSTTTHSSGVYIEESSGILIEECLLDHNGWSEEIVDAEPTIFNHNFYCQSDTADDFVFRRNISARASSHGIQARAGGLVEDNLFVRNPLGIQLGSEDQPRPGGVTGNVTGNVVLEGTDISGDKLRGQGIEIYNLNPDFETTVDHNILSTVSSGRPGFGIVAGDRCTDYVDLAACLADGGDESSCFPYGDAGHYARCAALGAHNLRLSNNIVYDWGQPLRFLGLLLSQNLVENNIFEVTDAVSLLVQYFRVDAIYTIDIQYAGNTYFSNNPAKPFQILPLGNNNAEGFEYEEWFAHTGETDPRVLQVSFADPGRNLATYQESLGREATFEAFIAEARKQSRRGYRPEYAAMPVIEYLRAGFEIVPPGKGEGR